jgi:hypothetical protein
MISTKNLKGLPDKNKVQAICKAVSVLDAILSQEWVYRYYSYNCKWAENEEFCQIRNGQGDDVSILFNSYGCVINGMAHEFLPKNKTKLIQGLPKAYEEFILGEPVASLGTTFCIWTNPDGGWVSGDLEDFNDGSEEFLKIFDGNPNTYIDWAKEYYEDAFTVNSNTIDIVSGIYAGEILTSEIVLALVSELEDWDHLENDLLEIDYPHEFSE